MLQLTFHGAAETVTGSKYLLETDQATLLVDCGLFQGLKELRDLNWRPPQFDPRTIDAVVLTHAHLDHVGYLPQLVKDGFRGRVFATPATRQLARLILLDSAVNQERDAEYANDKKYTRHKPALPLYNQRDAEASLELFEEAPRDVWFKPAQGMALRYHEAGHLLGSCWLEMRVQHADKESTFCFSGDVGRYNAPYYHDPAPPLPCDFLVCESTYGNRDHDEGDLLDNLEAVVERALDRGGVMLMASFAVGRAQQLVYLLQSLFECRRIKPLSIFVDSPMAVDASKIFLKHPEDHELSERCSKNLGNPFVGPNVFYTRTVEQSKKINAVHENAVIISSSGMMEGGRILHHLKQRLPDPRNTIVLGGFMAPGTRGRSLQEGARFLRMHGGDFPVRAAVEAVSGLSGHAGKSELLRWTAPLPPPKQVFLTHGEIESAQALAETFHAQRNWNCHIPKMGQTFDLENLQ